MFIHSIKRHGLSYGNGNIYGNIDSYDKRLLAMQNDVHQM